ncbi:glycosyltransferase family protein [Microbacterium sp. A93]|uniref:glycosyltransferase family protein n=1 Tax=Microbacterium sp. A93 TaxID=3450716 RepID=UPI003F4275FC
MKIAIFTTAHPLDDVRVYSKFAKSFLSQDLALDWIGPSKSYFAGDDFRDSAITYNLFSSSQGKLGRLLAIPRSAIRLAQHRGADWIYCPDPDAAAVAVALKPLHRASVIFDVHEEFHTGILSKWLGHRVGRSAGNVLVRALRVVTKRSDLVVGVSPAVLTPYVDHMRRSLIVKNSAPDWFADISGKSPSISEPAHKMRFFHGKALNSNGTTEVLEALSIVPDGVDVLMFPSPGEKTGLPYMSGFDSLVDQHGVRSKLAFRDSVPHASVPSLMDSCHVGMIGYGRELGRASLPNRLFEYMARGLAVMAPTYSPLIREIVESYEVGICRDFEDPRSIADGIRWFRDHPEEAVSMGARAREAFLEEFSWQSEYMKMSSAMEEIHSTGLTAAKDFTI